MIHLHFNLCLKKDFIYMNIGNTQIVKKNNLVKLYLSFFYLVFFVSNFLSVARSKCRNLEVDNCTCESAF